MTPSQRQEIERRVSQWARENPPPPRHKDGSVSYDLNRWRRREQLVQHNIEKQVVRKWRPL